MSATGTEARTNRAHGLRRLVGTGLLATLVAAAVAGLVATLARAAGVDLTVDGGEAIPVSGVVFQAGVLSAVGVVIAAALLRWSGRPADRFVATAAVLTAASLVPPLLWGRGAATIGTLIALHLVVAGVMIPILVRSLRSLR